MWTFYILLSPTVNKYYIGFTGDTMEERLRKHNSKHKGFTGGAEDWKVVYTESYESKAVCSAREIQVKKWKSRRLIGKLIGSVHPD